MNEVLELGAIVIPAGGRQDMGNVLPLAASIADVGLLHPLVVNTRRELIAGRRRFAAVKRLGWATVPVRVVDSLDDALLAVRAERDENYFREPLKPTELVEVGLRLEALEKPNAKQRQKEHGATAPGKRKDTSGKLPEVSIGQTRDKVASALGVSGKTYEKAKAVVAAAAAEPELHGDLPALMEAKSVDAAHRELRDRQQPVRTPGPPKELVEARRLILEFCARDERAPQLAEALACLNRLLNA